MKIIKIIGSIIVLLLVVLLTAHAYYGGFKKISPTVQECGGETLVYEKITGDYKQSGVVSDRVYHKLVNEHGIETYKGFGIYYDNPQTVEQDKLRADIGCILESGFDKLEALKVDFEVTEYPVREYLVAEFPYKGTPSMLLGIMKVYPALNTYSEENGYTLDSPVMEIWDETNKRITYRKELIKVE